MSHTTEGEIVPGRLYSLSRAQQLLNWGAHSMRQARRAGLQVKYLHNRSYIAGDELIRYVQEQGKSSKGGE